MFLMIIFFKLSVKATNAINIVIVEKERLHNIFLDCYFIIVVTYQK